jgi:hypothetical protein
VDSLTADLISQAGSLKAKRAGAMPLRTITAPSLWNTNAPMMRRGLILALALPLGAGLAGCADREDVRAQRMADQSTAGAADDAACRGQGAPGSAAYDSCRQDLAAQRAQKAEIQYQKRRYFDRVLGAGTDGVSEY